MQAKKRSGTRSAAKSSSKPLEPITYFVDESLDSHSVVKALREAGASVKRLTEHFPKGTPDETWLDQAGRNGWVVLTRDKRIRYRQLERTALREAKVRAFVFTGGNVTGADTALILVSALGRLEKLARADSGPFIYHIGISGKPVKMQ